VLLLRDIADLGSAVIVNSLAIEGDGRTELKAGTPRVVLRGHGMINQARFSPDGRWLAITDIDGPQGQVYVVPYPPADSRVPISTSGGFNPVWSETSKELYFGAGRTPNTDGQIMAVSYRATANDFHADPPRPLPIWYSGRHGGRPFDLHPDGKRFVLEPATAVGEDTKNDNVVVVTNFFDEIRALVK